MKSLLSHRFRRALLPFLLGLVTIVPAVNWISGWAIASAFEANAAKAAEDSIWSAAKNGHLAAMERHLKNGADINGIDPASGQTPLVWAALLGRVEAVDWLILSPVRLLYLIPLTMLPQSLMGLVASGFGPDTSSGLLPMPHTLLYYALFFAFGTLYFDCDDPDGRVGKCWGLALPLGLLIVFPLGLEFSTGAFGFRQEIFDPAMARVAAVALQATYAWMMTFACMGLFRKLCARENKTIRYLSDSSYWLYATHVPLVIGAQLAAFSSGKVLPSCSRRHRSSVADLPISRPLHLAGQTAEWSSRPPDELALRAHLREGILVSAVRGIIEEDETHVSETIVRCEKLLHRTERDSRGLRDRITVHAGTDGWEGNRLLGELRRVASSVRTLRPRRCQCGAQH